jgi:hypothetical protein
MESRGRSAGSSYRTHNLEIAEICSIHPKVSGKETVGIYKGMGAYHKIT